MSISRRKYLYDEFMINGNREPDFLSRNYIDIDLDTIDRMRINGAMQYRPDLISNAYYKTFDMGWLIALHNDFMDPIFDFEIGTVVDIPDLDQYFRYYKANARSA